jgi:hypothetical protein
MPLAMSTYTFIRERAGILLLATGNVNCNNIPALSLMNA